LGQGIDRGINLATIRVRGVCKGERLVNTPNRISRATYRVQFSADFTFHDALAIVPYLYDLGISDLYASPILQARPGSTHGYDVVDYTRLNKELGTEQDFDTLVAALREYEMGLLLDIVPNHMGASISDNRWWFDVLENGVSSTYAGFFDIDWHPAKPELAHKVLLPILEDQYGAVLEQGKITLRYEGGALYVCYGESKLPVRLNTYAEIISDAIRGSSLSKFIPELESILIALGELPFMTRTEPKQVENCNLEKKRIKRRLVALVESNESVLEAVKGVLDNLNGTVGEPRSFDRLDALLQVQSYRMAFWRVATDEINYRRFFDINEMVAIRIEAPEVFEAAHERIFQMLADGSVTGLRIDHPDGLWNPADYFGCLQEKWRNLRNGRRGKGSKNKQPLYLLVEKILSESEPLPQDWAVSGTTGYDFLNVVNGLFVNMENEGRLTDIYQRFVGREMDYEEIIYGAKRFIMSTSLSSEIRSLSHRLERITEANRHYRDFTLHELRRALAEVIASLSIYRTYICDPHTVSERDQHYILEAIVNARLRNPDISRLLFTFIRDTLLLHNIDQFSEDAQKQVTAFVMKFQQLTGPVMAKSVEDTTFYIYNRLASLNEVGGHPEQFGTTLDAFHQHNQKHIEQWPHTMLATSTHDTKRSEDVRARIDVLSEIPDEWDAALQRWQAHNADKKVMVDDAPAPDANEEYLYYQTLLGAWSDDETLCERLTAYMNKAVNESKVHTSWLNPNENYNAAVETFVQHTLNDREFMDDFMQLQQRVTFYGRLNAISQTLLKLTAPGVPDIYQGMELWNLSLVDPDNRRPVDYEQSRQILGSFGENPGVELEDMMANGRAKLYLIAKALAFRKAYPDLFTYGTYTPVAIEGERKEHVCAFIRQHGEMAALVVVPRLVVGLLRNEERIPISEQTWGDTRLVLEKDQTDTVFRSIFTGESLPLGSVIRVADVLNHFPVGLLHLTHSDQNESQL
jgi:(1->4)-alpha-D-glucan 1-alpha-D-glucosylmutase